MTTRPYRDPLEQTTLLDPPGGAQLRLRFCGSYQDPGQCWDARILALPAEQGNYIRIGAETGQGRSLEVGIRADTIDLPTVRKVLLMIRQYKRLAPGLQQFG